MDIPFPPELQWVSYLAGGAWPQGSETRMGRIGEHFATAAGDLEDLVPDLNRVRNETLSVLFGDTASAASDQFSMLFDGDYSVDKLTQGASALGGGAQDLSVQIEYSKLSIIVGLALAAVEIAWCLANSPETGGASLGWIPPIEWTTMTSIRRLVTTVFENIAKKLVQMLKDTTIKDLIHHGTREAFQELAQGLAQEGITQGIQVGKGRAGWRPDLFRQNAIASFAGGAAGGGTALPTGHFLGRAESKLGRAAKGMTTMFTAGISGNIAGTTVVGGDFDTLAVIAGSAGSSVGGVKGLGHGAHGENESNTGQRGQTPPADPRPEGSRTPDTPIDPLDDSESQEGDSPDSERRPDTSAVSGNGHAAAGGKGSRVSDPASSGAAPAAAKHTNGVAAQKDSSTSTPPATGDDKTDSDADSATQDAPAAKRTSDGVAPPTHSPDGAPQVDTDTINEPEGHRPSTADPVTGETPPAQHARAPEVTPHAGPSQSTVDPATAPQTDAASAVDPVVPADASPSASAVTPSVVQGAPAAAAPSATPPVHASPSAAAPATHAPTQTPGPIPKRAGREGVPATPTPSASTSEVSEAKPPAATVQDTTAAQAKPSAQQSEGDQGPVARSTTQAPPGSPGADPTSSDTSRPAPRRTDCVDRVAQALSRRHGRPIRLAPFSTAEGAPARVLYETFRSRAEFASYRKIAKTLQRLGPGSSAIVTSSWAGGAGRGGHAYLAVNEGGRIYLDDPFTGARTGWPPHWGRDAVSRVAVGYLHSDGSARHELGTAPRDLAAAVAVGNVQGHPSEMHGDHDPGARWRDVTPQRQLADDALGRRGVRSAGELRNPLGLMEAADERARHNTAWWNELSGDEQRALLDIYPHEIGNAEGIPATARHEANTRALDEQRRELQQWRDRGERLTRFQRQELARLERVQHALDRATVMADEAGVGRPQLLAFDSGAFGGSGRAVVSFGEDPYKADLVAWHVPGQGMTIDQIGPCMGDALNHLRSIRAEDSSVSASAIAWIGYDTPSGWNSWRAAGHTLAREGAKILYADIRSFNAARDTLAGDGSHFSGNHIFAHSYGSTTASYAGQDGRLANDIRTITLAGSPGVGPLRHASDFGIGADNVFVASSSRDPFTALGGRRPGTLGRIFGLGVGMDPAMESFGAHRVTAEFSGALDHRGTRFTHNSYFRFEDRGADPPVRSESLANFGRIATGHLDRIDTEAHRTIAEHPRRHLGGTRERTVEPAADRPLRLDGDTERHRGALGVGNPRWRGEHTGDQHTNDEHALDHEEHPPESLEPPVDTRSDEDIANDLLRDRGISADDLVNPFKDKDPARADELARQNAAWWAGLTEDQRGALVRAYPQQVGSAEGIYTEHRDAANRATFKTYRDQADEIQEKINKGEKPSKDDLKFLRRVNKIDMALRNGEAAAARAGVGGPKLLYFDPMEFGKDGRAIVSFGEDPYKAENVAWLVPGFGTTIDKLHVNMRNALHLLESALREKPTLSASSIAWIGYDAPNDMAAPRVGRSKLARDGGEILYNDIRAFNGARNTWAGDGSEFKGNHIYGHSYGSTATSHAGFGGRLREYVTTITLLGSPGAGDLTHASDFGLQPGKVFVASSSWDPVTAFGGRAPGEKVRLIHDRFGLGLGMDPAMKSFGAVRITAEFPLAWNRSDTVGTHTAYYQYVDPGGHPGLRNESLANFGRILAGHHDAVHKEEYRTLDDSRRRAGTNEPAARRQLRLDGSAGPEHSGGRDRLFLFNPRWRAADAGETRRLADLLKTFKLSDGDDAPADLPIDQIQRTIDPELAEIARNALRDRVPPVAPDQLVNPLHQPGVADARARANAKWWGQLNDDQRHALVHTYANQIGNAEGIHAHDRDAANREMVDLFHKRAAAVQAKITEGEKVSDRDFAFLLRMNKFDTALDNAGVAAEQAGVGRPLLLAFDPPAFKGDGRAVLSFGDDPYTAKSVAWYVPGVGAQMDRLDYCAHAALNILQSTRHENPTLSAASIAWIGYDAPNGMNTWRAAGHRLAREGGHILYSDIRAFNAARDTMAGDGSHFSGNHIFGHSYGSTTTSYAGQGGRLARHVRTITLIGSPGAGPIRHASAFDIGDNVFVASSSVDRIARFGGLTPTSGGRFAGLGLGTDPAMKSFGARRVAAEFLPEMNRKDTTGTHNAYFDYLETDGPRKWLVTPHSPIRTEALANLGRIAAGNTTGLQFEGHRTLDQSGDRVDPAERRRLHHDDAITDSATTDSATTDSPSDEGHRRFRLFRKPLPTNDCGPRVLDELRALYPHRRFRLRVDPSPSGVPARHLFLAARSGSRFATYDDVTRQLQELGRGSSALLVSRWSGDGRGGHAYLAINTGDEIVLYDPHTRERSGWPPHWGQDAVARTAVGYLKPNGKPLDPHNLETRKLGAADAIGRVRGLPSDDILALRDPQVAPHELRNPVGSAEEASVRARANAAWWSRLSDTQQQKFIASHPDEIGNAEGIPARNRNDANHRVLQNLREQADGIRTRIDEFGRPSASDRRFLDRVDRIDLAVRKATADAERAGLDPPMLLALDPTEFGGRGHVVLSFGEDPYHAQKVSWHTAPEPIDRFSTLVSPALDQLQTDRQITQSASAVVWIGDESRSPGALHSDLYAYHVAREALSTTDDNTPFTGVRVYTGEPLTTEAGDALWVPRDTGSLIVAHRGASHEYPEQTLAAYREALRQGADGLECDVRLTKDGQLVCIHDKRIDRTSNGTGRVRDMTLAELQEFDFGSRHPSHQLGDAQGDTGILTLDELLQLVKSHDRPVTLFIEAKEHGGRLERELAALLDSHGLANPASPAQSRVAVISFYPDAIWRLHRAAPDVPTVLLGSAARHLAPLVGATGIGPSIATLRAHPEIVDIAARQGLTTYCWTVNDEGDVQFARDLGVGWIATDHPGRTSDLLHGNPTEPAAHHTPVHQSDTPTPDTAEQAAIDARHARAVADAALAQRIPPVRPDELRNPLGPAEESRARARNNAAWWDRLTEDQQQALIKSYPHDIGNAEGISAAARHDANHRVVQELRDRADRVQSKIDDGVRPTRAERKLLRQVNRLDLALRKATADAERAGVGEPLLLAFDPAEFGGDGRAVLSFGADPYKADSVSWHVPGVATTVHSLFGFYTECALNHLQSTLTENPSASVASIAWIGYDTPSGLGLFRAAGHKLARTGGDLLHSDITAFNAARDVMAGDGSHFSGNHIFGYSYGSTTTGYAGQDGRLAGEITTVSLVGSPGAGPVRHAAEFGIGADHIFVASSSRDVVTALGGRAPGSSGRILGIGLGVDPAMDHFGAHRIAAEFPPARNQLLTGGTHHAYYLNTDTGSRVRSESLTNLGRIAAGHHEQVSHETHRTADGWRTVEPAAQRSEHRFWNPRWRGDQHQGARADPDFVRRQEEYRAQDPANRHVDTRYADPLGDVVDNPTQDSVDRLARDLSGTYGPYRIRLDGEALNGEVLLTGEIYNGDTKIGTIQRSFYRDGDGNLVAYQSGTVIDAEFEGLRGKGFSKALTSELERYYVHSGVDRIGTHTHDVGGFAWARRGFTWDPDPGAMQNSFDAIKSSAGRLRDQVGPAAQAALDDIVRRLDPNHPRLPEPIDVANLATPDEPELGKRLLQGLASRQIGGSLDLVKYMARDVSGDPIAQSHSGFAERLKRFFGLSSDSRSNQDCAHLVADELSRRYYGRDFRVAIARSRTGTPAWALFEAARTRAESVSYDDVRSRLDELGDGSAAILVSRWADGRSGGHAYLAIRDGDEVYLFDPSTGERSGWPPHWGQGAVSHTAAGFLNAEGIAERELDHTPVQQQLADADLVGDVRGHPGDLTFQQRQDDYRGQDLATRHVDTRYAEPLADVVDNVGDLTVAQRLADDLSGVYGPYRIRLDALRFDSEVRLSGDIFDGDTKVGRTQWILDRAADGHLVATNSGLVIDDQFKRLRGKGFSRTYTSELERYFVHSGVDRIELHAHAKGGYAWPRMGYTWNPEPRALQESLAAVRASAIRLGGHVGPEARAVLDQIVQRLDPNHPRLPEPIELANLATADEPELGRRLMEGSSRLNEGVNLVRYLAHDSSTQAHSGFGTRLKRLFGLGGESRSTSDCAHLVVDKLSAMYRQYDREFRLARARSHMGTPSWALFEAVNTRAEFTNYADVPARLHTLGDGAAAVLVSRWANGRQGGHAYLAIKEGHDVYLYDPHTGERSKWPPHWGQQAVAHTAVGYLNPDGSPEHKLTDAPLQNQLGEADRVGDVRGHPSDPDFVRRQDEYRAQDPVSRRVDSRYADPLGPVVDSASSAGAGRLADDLSGVYGPYRLELEGLRRGPAQSLQDGGRPRVVIEGAILSGDRDIGDVAWSIYRDDEGNLVAHHELYVDDDDFRGWEFRKALNEVLAPYYARHGVDHIVTTTLGKSAYAAADLGDTWDPDPESLQTSLDHVKKSARLLSPSLDDEARAVLDQIVQRLEPWHPRLPDPADLAHLTTFGEPHLGRRLLEGTGADPDGTGSGLNYVKYLWNDRLQSDQNCAHWVAEALSDRYGITVTLDAPPTAEGVPARALFEAVGSRAEFATHDEIAELLFQMSPGRPGEPGPAAIVVSSWAGGESRGGHAYLAVCDGGRISLIDPFTGERSGWPPYWGESTVSRTAVGFLTSAGRPVLQLDGSANELAAADVVGNVQGLPDDSEFVRQQVDYRAQDPISRTVDTRYAEPLAEVVDHASEPAMVRQLADDLSGVFGPYRVEMFRAEVSSAGEVIIGGHIMDGDNEIGFMQRTFFRDAAGKLVAHHDVVEINQQRYKFKGFSRALAAQLDPYYDRSGVDRIELRTEQDGGDVWARRGFTWNTNPVKLHESLQSVKDSAANLLNWVSDDAQAVLRETVARLDPGHPRLPEPIELASLATPEEPDLGRQLMHGTQWHGVKYLRGAPDSSIDLSHSGVDATLEGGELHGTNCAHLVAHQLWEMYDLEIDLDPATAAGVPARALFEAVGTNARFIDTYDDVAAELIRLGPGSSAILASRWAGGRQGGHAYLAINVGDEIFLVESHSGRQLGWPPYWGDEAVARTVVGYLDSEGNPRHPLHDVPLRLQLADADAIGEVQGGAYDPVGRLGLPDYEPRSLSDVEANTVYSHGEHRMRELNEQLIRDGVSLEDRARILSEQRNSLRAWTRELMSNRTTAEVLAANESNHTFADLVARHEERGLTGDAVYEAIIDTATHSRYAPGTLSGVETTQVYSDFEQRLRDLNEQLTRDGVSVEERARALSDLRSSLRTWTRELMANRAAADWLAANETPLSFDDLVARKRARGLVGDAVYEDIIDSATHSHYPSGTLSDLETRTVYTTLELRMREVHDQLRSDGVNAEERARTLYGLRASIRTWARALMADREAAESLDATDPNPTFEALVERQRDRGRVGDEIYEAIIASATRSRDSVNKALGIDPENPPPLPPMRGPTNNE